MACRIVWSVWHLRFPWDVLARLLRWLKVCFGCFQQRLRMRLERYWKLAEGGDEVGNTRLLGSRPAEPVREVRDLTLLLHEGACGGIQIDWIAVAQGVEVGHAIAGAFYEAGGWEFPDVVGLRFGMRRAAGNRAAVDGIGSG